MTTDDRRYVYGTRTQEWYLVDWTDRDYEAGITVQEMAEIGRDAAKEKYLSACYITPTAATMGRKGGSARTPAKQKASRENGKLGGRPKNIS